MKSVKLFVIVLTGLNAMSAMAQTPTVYTKVISDVSSTEPVDLNSNTVLCTSRGYTEPELKVLLPALAGATILEHRKPGENAPCISAGACSNTLNPDKFLSGVSTHEKIQVEVKLTRTETVDSVNKTCEVTLVEDVTSSIGGDRFESSVSSDLGARNIADCGK